MKVKKIRPDMLEGIWPLIDKYVKDATSRSQGRHSPSTIFNGIFNEVYELWLAIDETKENKVRACVVTQQIIYPTGLKSMGVLIATGESRKEWGDLVISTLEDWAMENGCSMFEMFARKSWAREFKEYKLTHVLLEKLLPTEGLE